MSIRHELDPAFDAFLLVIRSRRPTATEIDDVLGDNMGYSQDTVIRDVLGPNCVCLCTHNKQVRTYNSETLHKCFPPQAIAPVPLITNASQVPALREWHDDPDFQNLTEVAIGAPVIFTTSGYGTARANGQVNGATGKVAGIGFKRDGTTIAHLLATIDHTGKTVKVNQTNYDRQRIDGNLYYKRCFPLSLGYAMTIHKAMGATITETVVIDIHNAFALGMLYVALSRKTDRSNLFIVGQLTPDDFIPVPLFA